MAKRPARMVLAAAVMILALAAACGGPEEKKVKFFNRALELFEKGDYVKARLEVKNALQIDPKYAEGYQLLGRIEQKAGNLKEAFGAFGKAVELKPELSLSQIEMGKMLLMGGATDKAMERAEAVLAKEPENVDALILKGSVLLVNKHPDGAIAVFEGLRTRGVKNPEVYMALANAHVQKKNAAQAEKMLQEGVAANPDSVPLRLVLAKFFLDGLKPDKAEAELQQVIRQEPGNPRHRINLAALHWEQGRQAVAIDLLTEMVAADPAKAGCCSCSPATVTTASSATRGCWRGRRSTRPATTRSLSTCSTTSATRPCPQRTPRWSRPSTVSPSRRS